MNNQNIELISFANADELAARAASAWLDEIAAANHAARPHCVALSGGRIALKFFTSVVAQAKARELSLGLVHFFWADERCVPPDDAESNFCAAHELLFAPLQIGDAQIHRIHGEDSPEIAAQKATMDISHVAPKNSDGQPVLDLIFLGMGEDGHVASLFPTQIEGAFPKAIFCAIRNSPKPPPDRVSLSYETIATAREVWVLASGAGKKASLHESIVANGRTPLARVIQSRPHTKIFSDFRMG
ncbi:MAG TPA: 6-phosphogluconolactonase [Verrucomicrobiae bacterium]